MSSDAQRVVAFWFDRPPMDWLRSPTGLDDEIRSQFGDLVLKARSGELDSWAGEPIGSLALVVMLDQFTRNLYRDSAEQFSGDEKAFELATEAIAKDFDKQVSFLQASAFYMALMKQETKISLITARTLLELLKQRAQTDEERQWADLGVNAFKNHWEQIERFGRYPTRNIWLGRKSSPDEEAFIKERTPGAQIAEA